MGLWSLTLYKGVQHYMLNKIQNKIRNTETRLKLSIFAGVLAVFLSGSPVNMQKTMVYGWWGTLYPEFCFEGNRSEEIQPEKYERPKISFWLAKVLDR